MVHEQQKRYLYEKTWYREVKVLLTEYKLEEDENEICKIGKEAWNTMVNKNVCSVIVDKLDSERKQGKKTKLLPAANKLECKEYLKKMTPKNARLLFRIRRQIVDLRGIQKYKYDDQSCRLCGAVMEDINHVLNECIQVVEKTQDPLGEKEIYGDDLVQLHEIATRVNDFYEKIREKESLIADKTEQMTE